MIIYEGARKEDIYVHNYQIFNPNHHYVNRGLTSINTHGLEIPIVKQNSGLYLSTPNRYVYKGINP